MCEHEERKREKVFKKDYMWPIESVQSHSFSFDWKAERTATEENAQVRDMSG